MNTSEQILVITLGIMLALFLLLSILTLVQVLRLAANLRRISEKAEKLVDSAETAMQHKKEQRGK